MMADLYQEFKDRFTFRFELVWNKNRGIFANKFQPTSTHELIWCFKKTGSKTTDLKFYSDRITTKGKRYKRYSKPTSTVRTFSQTVCIVNNGTRHPKSVLDHSPIHKGHDEYYPHPTQKPEEILTWIIDSSSDPGDIVLDCYLGSGSTAAAALRIGRDFKGCEKDPDYFKMAKRRIDAIQNQKKLI